MTDYELALIECVKPFDTHVDINRDHYDMYKEVSSIYGVNENDVIDITLIPTIIDFETASKEKLGIYGIYDVKMKQHQCIYDNFLCLQVANAFATEYMIEDKRIILLKYEEKIKNVN